MTERIRMTAKMSEAESSREASPRPRGVRGAKRTVATTGQAARAVSSPTDIWQARIGTDLAAKLLEDAEVLGLSGKTDIVKAALELLHRTAAELRMARGVHEYYGDGVVPLPVGVVPFEESELPDDPDA